MSRRRAAKQQEKEVFLQANPTLIENTTHIEVAQDNKGRYRLEVTENDEDPVLVDGPGKWEGISIPEIGTAQWSGFDGPVSSGSWTALTLGEDGIGVAGIGDARKILKGGPDAFQSLGTISGKEKIKIEVEEVHFEPTGPFDEKSLSFLDHGGKSIGIDFGVIEGDGRIKIILIDDETRMETTHYFDSDVSTGRGRGTEPNNHIEVVMEEGFTFEEVIIRTTGDLEVSVVGIDLTTGYVEGMHLY